MNIELLENDGDKAPIKLGVLYNMTIIPRIKEKLAYKGKIYIVKDAIWHLDDTNINISLRMNRKSLLKI